MKIRHKISLIFLALVFISLSSLGLFSYGVAKHRLIEVRGEQLTAILLNQKESIRYLFTAWIDRSRLIASRTQLRASFASHLQSPTSQHLSTIKTILTDALLSVQLVERIVLCDLHGNEIVAVEKRKSTTPLCGTYTSHSSKLYTLKDIWMQENGGEQPSRLLVSIAGPLEHKQQPIGVVYTVINATELIDIVNNHTALGSTGETLLARRDEYGNAQFVTPLRFDANTGLKRRVSADAIRIATIHAMKKRKAKFHFAYALDYKGVPVLATTDYIPELDWGIVVKINRDEVLQPIYDLRNMIVAYIVIIMLLTLIISWFVGHFISQPITELAHVAQKIRDGDFSLRAQVSARDETSHLAATFNQMLDALQELERKVKEKTVLAEGRAAKVRELASSLTQAEQKERRLFAEMLHDQLQQLLVAAKISVNRLAQRTVSSPVQTSILEIGELLEESINTTRTLTVELNPPVLRDAGLATAMDWLARWMKEKHGLEISTYVEGSMKEPSEDRKIIIFKAVRELLFNVAKHAGTHRSTIRINQEENELRITVEDHGKGFDPNILSLASSTHFGLFNIQERLEFLDCRVKIVSAPGVGTQCTIYAPVEDLPSEDLVPKLFHSPSEKPHSRALVADIKIKILVVDDHKILRECLIRTLQDCPEVEVIGEATDGQEAVEKAMVLKPDVIIMDISMPRMTGIEATKKIKEVRPEIKIIGLSLHEAEDMAQLIIEAGASAYHCKSGPLDDLIHLIRRSQE